MQMASELVAFSRMDAESERKFCWWRDSEMHCFNISTNVERDMYDMPLCCLISPGRTGISKKISVSKTRAWPGKGVSKQPGWIAIRQVACDGVLICSAARVAS